MADYTSCKYYKVCDYRKGVGCCPENCVQYKFAAKIVLCKDCQNKGDEDSCPLLSLAEYTEDDDYCSFGIRRTDNG